MSDWSLEISLLGVSFGNMNSLNAEIFHQQCPFLPGFWLGLKLIISIPGYIYQSFFNKPTNHAWVSSTAWNCRGLIIFVFEIFFKSVSDSIVASDWKAVVRVREESFPYFLHCINIKYLLWLTILSQLFGAYPHAQINEKSFLSLENLIKNVYIVLFN